MMNLDSPAKKIEVLLGGAVTTNELPITASFVDVNQSSFAMVHASESDTQTNGGSAVTGVAAPTPNLTRQTKFFSVHNSDTVAADVTVRLNNGGTFRTIIEVTLQPGDNLQYVG